MKNNTGSPDVSVVICTFDRAQALGEALHSVVSQQTHDEFIYEVVVVDDGSTDATEDAVRWAAGSSPASVRYVRETGKGIAVARNRGIEEARGEWIAYFDDDQLAEPDWLCELLRAADEGGAEIVGGARRLRLLAQPEFALGPVARGILGEKDYGPQGRPSDRNMLACTGNVLIHRRVFDRIGRFDPVMRQGMTDIDLTRRALKAGIRSWYAPKAIVHHLVPGHRVGEGYLKWTCLRVGANLAWINQRAGGMGEALGRGSLRVMHALTWNLLVAAAARLAGRRGVLLDCKCLRWMAVGSARMVLHLALPGLLSQRRFLEPLAFRGERQVFGRSR